MSTLPSKNSYSHKVVDLFCGIGGLSYGFKLEGFNIAAGYDSDISCKYAFETNNDSTFILKDVAKVSSDEVKKFFEGASVKVLVGCAPCQPFSSYTFKDKVKSGSKWSLLYQFAEIIEGVQPDIVSMENVAQLLNFKKEPVFENFLNRLRRLNYHVHYEVVNCPDYGIPQKRRRLVLLASKFGKIDLIEKTHNPLNYRTVKDTIFSLPPLKDGEVDENDALHFARKLSPLNKVRIKATPYGGSWKNWPEELVLKCHKKISGLSYPSVYGRMKWEDTAPTMTTHCVGYGNGRFGHPEQDRAISLREAALIQTFPRAYKFYKDGEKYSSVTIARHLGNAVPVLLGQVVAKSIAEHLNQLGHENIR